MIDTSFLGQMNRFDLIVRKRVTSQYTGTRTSIYKGRGLVVKDHRQYVMGDDFRSIDWRIYARTDDLYIKQFEDDRSLTVHLIVDSSSSMDYGRSPKKFEYGGMIAVGFAYLTMRENEKFQFSTFSDRLYPFRPKKGMSQMASMLHHLNKHKIEGNSNLLETMMQYKKLLTSKSLVIVVSDFLMDVEQIKQALSLFGKHELVCVQVLDKNERHLEMEGEYKLKDSEDGTEMRTFVSPRVRKKYLEKLNSHMAEVQNTCDAMGAQFYTVTTDTPIFDTFYALLKNK